MRKVWMYKRKGIKGWWVGWYESGKRNAKGLPTKLWPNTKTAQSYQQLLELLS